MTIVKTTLAEAKKTKSRTDKERLENMTDEDIKKAALADPDSALPTDEELKQFKKPTDEYRKRFTDDKSDSKKDASE